eukprot:1156861-Pelagomonas_calceolata.AAC.6
MHTIVPIQLTLEGTARQHLGCVDVQHLLQAGRVQLLRQLLQPKLCREYGRVQDVPVHNFGQNVCQVIK